MILVVGGAGYIGAHTCKQLATEGIKHLVFDNLSQGHRAFVKWGDFFQGDLNNKADLSACFAKYDIDAVMHFSALANVGESVENPLHYYQNNVVGTLNLLEAMQTHKVKQFIFSSTCAIYGEPQHQTLSEDHPQNPISPYGKSKKMVEDIVQDYSKTQDMNYAFLRYFNAAGADPDGEIGEAHSPETHLIPLAIQSALGKQKLEVFGDDYNTPDGTCIRDYIHVNDLANAHIKALRYLQEKKQHLKVNLGSGVGYSVMEIIKEVERVSGKTVNYQVSKRREGDPAILLANTDRSQDCLGVKINYTLDEIIETAWNWHNTQTAHQI